jgi:hypothetical protein
MNKLFRTMLAGWVFFVVGGACADDMKKESIARSCQKTSPITRNVLVELFTSDGCDSCPPANKWLSSAVRGGDKGLIPISMHVTYWNQLGWKDGFSKAFFDDRQDSYARQAINKFSYTPELFLNAREWRGWKNGGRNEIADAEKESSPISINLVATRLDNGNLSVETTISPDKGAPKVDLSAARLYVLLYEDDLTEHPNAGELKNVLLKHDHVIRDWKITDAIPSGKAVSGAFSIAADWNPKKMGVVAFVQSNDLKSIYQVIDLPLCFQ